MKQPPIYCNCCGRKNYAEPTTLPLLYGKKAIRYWTNESDHAYIIECDSEEGAQALLVELQAWARPYFDKDLEE